MSRFAVGYSDLDNSRMALKTVCEQLSTGMGRKEPILVVFCSDSESFEFYSKQLRRRFPFSTVIGMTAYMGFSSRGYGKHSLSCISITEGIEIKAGRVNDPKGGFGEYVDKVIDTLGKLKDKSNTICFSCGAKMFEYTQLIRLEKCLKDEGIKFCGGSIGEEEGAPTKISFNGEICERGGLYCFIHNLKGRVELFAQSMSGDVMENIWNKALCDIKDCGLKPEFSIVANGIDYTKRMEEQNMLYKFTDMLCMEFGEYMGFTGYKDKNFFKISYDSMLIAMFE